MFTRSGEDLAKAVRHALKWNLFVPDQRITSTVSNGIVTLQGNVESWVDRSSAERAIQQLTGAKGVINQITVAAKPVGAGQIKQQIEDALERQTEREAKRIHVAVNDGVVTITGSLRSWGEKNAVERAALFTTGVRRVDDRTTVDPYQ